MTPAFRSFIVAVLLIILTLQGTMTYCVTSDYRRASDARAKREADERYSEKLRKVLGNP